MLWQRSSDYWACPEFLSQYANLLIPFVSMGMSNAIIRFGLDRGNSKKQVFTNGLLSILLGYAALILLWPVARLLPDMAQYGLLLYVYVLMSCLRTLCTQFVRSQEFNKLVAVDGILCTFATLMFYVLYLVVLGMGANGYLLAIISGDLTSVVFLTFKGRLWQYLELKTAPNTRLWKQMLRFSLPMIPAQISFWVINASDLFFVREMCGGMGGHSGEAWRPAAFHRLFSAHDPQHAGADLLRCLAAVCGDGGEERETFFTRIFRIYSCVMFCCGAGILWLCRPLMHVMKASYYEAWRFVPFLTLAAVCSCYSQFLNSVYVVYKRSVHSLVTMLAGAVANCVLNYFLILWWGPVGASVASFVSLGLVFALRAVDTHRMLRMSVHPGRVAVNFVLLAAEALVLLAEVPLYGLWTGLDHGGG